MNYNDIITTIVDEPIYLSICVIFALIIIYSLLKKFFKLLVVALSVLLIYIGFLIYNGDDLPGDSDDIINPIIDNAGNIINDLTNKLKNSLEEKD